MTENELTPTDKLRKQARDGLDDGPITEQVRGQEEIRQYLQTALSTEIVCALRYTQNAIVAADCGAEIVAREFEEHAEQEFAHAKMFAERMSLLGGIPSMNPSTITQQSHAEYFEITEDQTDAVEQMIKENLVAERIAIASYTEIIRAIGERDPTTRRLFEAVLEQEEEHADELMGLRRFSREHWQAQQVEPTLPPAHAKPVATTQQLHHSGTPQA